MRSRTLGCVAFCFCALLHQHGAEAAAVSDNGPGCGLGKLAWMDYESPKQIAPQVMMATTNATFGSQTFGISSGTSGCSNDGVIIKNKHINIASHAFDRLAEDMAQGKGEYLASLAMLLGVPEETQPEFFALVQERYQSLVGPDDATAITLLTVLQTAMAERPALAHLSFVGEDLGK
ncbi:MAG: conserved exported protein of unknown function [Nitrospira sp.]